MNSYIIADEDSTLCFFDETTILRILRTDEELLRNFLKTYTSKVGYFMRQAFEKGSFSPKIRILRLLHGLCQTRGQASGAGYIIPLKLSQKTISEITDVHYVAGCRSSPRK
ncbi:MAG: hypothetical protein LBS10_05000 [Gracilibacteraceae bacterium]|jgi:CRP-like cAMP-binding protein|nr:hypothetical protein [Gracilibacteraceae bacterium]